MTLAAINAGLPMLGHLREGGTTAPAAETPAHRKLRKAAEEFEGILISQLLGQFQTGFSSLAGDAPLTGSDTLNSLAVQALSNAMAHRGGFGIGQMLVRQLEPSLNRGQQSQGGGKIKTASRG
jgi:Rod binding domain-containing protein